MSTPLTPRRRGATLALVLATGAAGSCLLGAAAPALAEATAPGQAVSTSPSPSAADGETAVASILLGAGGRPTFVEVTAPTVEQAVQRAAHVPGSDGVAVDSPMTALVTNDPHRAVQWSLDALKADSLPAPTGRSSHVVAVVDTGVRASHEDFAAGQVRCDLGADFTGEGLGACKDPKGHGTHVAGIIGAATGNGKGVASLAPGTTILPVRVLDSAGSGGSIAVAKGIVHAADKGAEVINLSLGGPGGSSALDAAVQYATDKGSLVVVSAGNNRTSGNEVNYPAASPGALSVASTEQSGTSSSFSYRGPSVDLAAPGGGIASLWGSDDRAYAMASGTSMAAPAVSAVASLYRAANPSLTPAQVTAALLATATDLEAPGRDDSTGAGLVNPYRLLVPAQAAPTAPTAPAAPTAPPAAPVQQPAPVVTPPVVSPSPVVTPPAPKPSVTKAPVTKAPVTKAPVAKVPVPRVRVGTSRVARKQAVPLVLTDYRPASVVTVLETFPVTTRTQVRVNGRTVTRTSRTSRTVVLGSFRVAANGSVNAKVLPVQTVAAGTLIVRGFDRAAKVVQTTAAIRVG